jgi:hypothetical protein
MIGMTENLADRLVGVEDQPRAGAEPVAENGMPQIGLGLRQRSNCVSLRSGTGTEPFKLRKNEPHPVTSLPPRSQFREDVRHERLLGFHEAPEVERVGVLLHPVTPVSIRERQGGHCVGFILGASIKSKSAFSAGGRSRSNSGNGRKTVVSTVD